MAEEKTLKKKQLILAGIGLAFLLVLVIGATYAYFTFTSQNDFKDPATIESGMGELGAGVTLTKAEDSTLTLNLSAADMLVENAQTYYASGSETPKTIATIAVQGAGYYNCTYTLEVTKTATSPETDMYERFQSEGYTQKSEGQVWFTINDTTYDFNTANLFDENGKLTYTGTLETISNAEDINLTANMVIVNSDTLDQTYLNGTDISLSVNATEFKCTLINDKPVVTSLSTAGVGTDSLGIKVETADLHGIESYTFSIDGGEEVTQEEDTYTFENLELNTEYEITTYVTNTEGYKSEEVTQTFSTLSTANMANAVVGLEGKGEVANIETLIAGDYTNATIVTDALYEVFSGTDSTTSGTTIDNAFTYSDGIYTSIPENMNVDTSYNVQMTIPSDGYYRVCFETQVSETGSNNGNLLIYKNDNRVAAYYNHHSHSDCFGFGYMYSDETIKVTQSTSKNAVSTASVKFYIERSNETKELNPGYRYQGAGTHNYVEFNNGEIWRIIGVEAGSAIGLEKNQNYVKLIKNASIGMLAYDTDGNHEGDWSTTSLYTLLNGDYYNRLNDYAETGLTEDSKELITNANWYFSSQYLVDYTAREWYINERSYETKVVKSAVGLMSPSDYVFSADADECSNILPSKFNTSGCFKLIAVPFSRTIIPATPYTSAYYAAGLLVSTGAATTLPTNPSVYLDTDVIITGGNGSELSPYQIAKPTT